jgi:LPXTG-motif cell wall-anchored protein
MKKYLIFVTAFIISMTSHAKLFQNSYVSFQLPQNWTCKVAGTEWVCRSSNNVQAKQAVIVLTAKEVGPNDNFAYYNQYLKTPKTPKHRDGTVATMSKVQHLKTVQIANHPWVDGLHLGSLLPNFYSRYLVTIKNKIAVLVTFSAKKEFYTQYSKAFFDAINSLRVTANFTDSKDRLKGPNEVLGNIDPGMDPDDDGSNANMGVDGMSGHKKKSNVWLYGVALMLAGAGAFFLLKRKKKK